MIAEEKHITGYSVYVWVLIFLLAMTGLTISVTKWNLSAFSVLVAMVIAIIKGATVLTWFMHLKYESTLFRALVIVVLTVYALVIGLTFFDYMYR